VADERARAQRGFRCERSGDVRLLQHVKNKKTLVKMCSAGRTIFSQSWAGCSIKGNARGTEGGESSHREYLWKWGHYANVGIEYLPEKASGKKKTVVEKTLIKGRTRPALAGGGRSSTGKRAPRESAAFEAIIQLQSGQSEKLEGARDLNFKGNVRAHLSE